MSMTSAGAFMVKTELAEAGPSVAVRSSQIYDHLQSLRSKTSGLATIWSGPGAPQNYEDLQGRWNAASQNLFGDGTLGPDSIMGAIGENLVRIAEKWASTEQANTQAWLQG
jgi:uncharacterized protein YukE